MPVKILMWKVLEHVKDTKPLITIALLTKDSEMTVGHALASLAGQKLPRELKMEVIIIDDNSKDKTLDIVKQWILRLQHLFGGHIVRIILVQKYKYTGKIGFSRNVALNLALGEWILWLDSDSMLSPDYLSKAYEALKSVREGVAVIYPCRLVPLYNTRSYIQRALTYYSNFAQGVRTIGNEILGIPAADLIYGIAGTLCRVKHLHEIRGFNSLLPAAEDVDVFIKLLDRGYIMEGFGGTLYHYVRSGLRSWFKQAVDWGYGQYTLSFLRWKKAGSINKEKPLTLRRILMLMTTTLKNFLKCLSRAVRVSKDDLCALLVPLLYIYRRVGYFIGWHYAAKQLK